MPGVRVVAKKPNAKYYVQKQECEHGRLQLEHDSISYMSPNYDPLLETGQMVLLFFFSSRRRHTRVQGDWSSDVCSSDLVRVHGSAQARRGARRAARRDRE